MFIWIALFSYILFAVNAVVDKYLLNQKRIGHPAAYAFAIGLMGIVAVVLAPFGFYLPAAKYVLLSLLAGALFTYALYAFFTALKDDDASRIVPVQGGFVPFFTLIFAYFLLGERLAWTSIIAFVFLVGGTLLMFPIRRKTGVLTATAVFAAVLFALSFTLTKNVFANLGFINGFVWVRIGGALGALALLLLPNIRQAIFHTLFSPSRPAGPKKSLPVFLTGQGVGALASVAQNYAISLGSVTLVNAMQGVQFVFVLLITIFLSYKYPKVIHEAMSIKLLERRFLGILLISMGIIALALKT